MGLLDRFKKRDRARELETEGPLFPTMGEDAVEELIAEQPQKAPAPTVEEIMEDAEDIFAHSARSTVGGEEEKQVARYLRDKTAEVKGVKSRLEPFYARPLLGKGSMLILAVLYLVILIFYFAYTPLALVTMLLATPIAVMLAMGRKEFSFLLPKKVAYNVVAVQEPQGEVKKTLVFSSNYDGTYANPYETGKLKKYAGAMLVYAFATLGVLFIMSIVKLAIGFDTPAKVAGLTVPPLILGLSAIFVLATYTSVDKKNVEMNSLKAAGAAFVAFKYYAYRPEELEDGTRLVYLCVSGKNTGNTGAERYVARHCDELQDASVLDVGAVASDDFSIITYDFTSMKSADETLTGELEAVLAAKGVAFDKLKKGEGDFSHNTFAPFAKEDVRAVTIACDKISKNPLRYSGEKTPLAPDTVSKLAEILIETAKHA